MQSILLKNAHIVDGKSPEIGPQTDILIEEGKIKELGQNLRSGIAEEIDLKGRTAMPGLIDCHVHVVAALADLGANSRLPDSLVTARSLVLMRNMLMRGFTTVRDIGGADAGLIQITREGIFPTPRVLTSGKALSQTGGHCDFRGRFNSDPLPAGRVPLGAIGRVCDGEQAIRLAARRRNQKRR